MYGCERVAIATHYSKVRISRKIGSKFLVTMFVLMNFGKGESKDILISTSFEIYKVNNSRIGRIKHLKGKDDNHIS